MDRYIKILLNAKRGRSGQNKHCVTARPRLRFLGFLKSLSPDACLPACSYSDLSKDCCHHSHWAQLDPSSRSGSEPHVRGADDCSLKDAGLWQLCPGPETP